MSSTFIRHLGRRRLAALGSAAFLAGCEAIPNVPGLAPRDIGLEGRTTPQPAGRKADALQEQFDLQAALSSAPLVPGNTVKLLAGGDDAFGAMFQALSSARNSINLEYFIVDNIQHGGTDLLTILQDRLSAGVCINMIYDSYGSRNTPDQFFTALRQAGAEIIAFNPIDPRKARTGWSPNHRDHRKIMVIDGRIGFTGGINLDKAYENPPSAGMPGDGDTGKAYWRDTAVRIDGPAVAELQKLFFGTWREQKAPEAAPADYFPHLPRAGVQSVRIIGSSPGDEQPLYYASLMTAIQSARRRIWLCSGYFIPPHQEREALGAAARSGIDVRIVAPAFSDVQSAVYAGRAAYGDLLEAGARIYEMHDGVVHAKIAVVDDTWTDIGSSNLDNRSVIFNSEVDAVMIGHDIAGQVETLLQGYMQAARPVELARWEHRSLGERVEEWKARLWQYWM